MWFCSIIKFYYTRRKLKLVAIVDRVVLHMVLIGEKKIRSYAETSQLFSFYHRIAELCYFTVVKMIFLWNFMIIIWQNLVTNTFYKIAFLTWREYHRSNAAAYKTLHAISNEKLVFYDFPEARTKIGLNHRWQNRVCAMKKITKNRETLCSQICKRCTWMNFRGCMLKFIIRSRFSRLFTYTTICHRAVFSFFYDFSFFPLPETKFTQVHLRGFVTGPTVYCNLFNSMPLRKHAHAIYRNIS